MKKRRGFTLVEMLVALVIAGIVMVAVNNLAINTLRASRAGFEAKIISEQFEQALDLIEEDVRTASELDVSAWSNPSETRVTKELHLFTVDARAHEKRGTVVYTIGIQGNAIALDTPPERPYPGMSLMRAQQDETHSGLKQSVVHYLNGPSEKPWGLRVYYYDKNALACSLAEDIYSVRVVLSGRTKAGDLVTRERQVPLTTKYE